MVAVLAVVAVLVMLLTSRQMSGLRSVLPPLSRAMSWLENLPVPMDMDHLAFFALVAMGLRIALPGVRWWRLLIGVAALAVVTELLQFLTVGRTPKLLDVRDDMLGGSIGLLLAGGLRLLASRITRVIGDATGGLLCLGVLLLPLQQLSMFPAAGVWLLPSDVAFIGAIGLRGLAWLGGKASVRWSPFHAWLFAYVAAMGLSCLLLLSRAHSGAVIGCPLPMPSLTAALVKWCGIVYLMLIALVVADQCGREGFMRRLAVAWIAAATVASFVSLLAIIGFYMTPHADWLQPLLSHYGSLPPGPYPRVQSLFANPNMFCNFLVVACAVLCGACWSGWIAPRRVVLLAILLIVAALATISPVLGGLVLLISLLAWWHLRMSTPNRARLVLGAGSLVALCVFAGMWLNLAAPFVEPSVRWRIWQEAFITFRLHAWRGIGLEMPVVGVSYLDPSGSSQWLTDAHNIWLNVGAQAGIWAVLALAGLSAWLLRHASRVTSGNAMAAALLFGFVAAFLYGGLSGSFEDARHLWILVGMLAASSVHVSRPPQSSANTGS